MLWQDGTVEEEVNDETTGQGGGGHGDQSGFDYVGIVAPPFILHPPPRAITCRRTAGSAADRR